MDAILKVLAWPAVALVLATGFLIGFRKPVAALLARTKKLGKGGIETYDAAQLPAPAEREDPVSQFLGTYDNPLLTEIEASIKQDLTARKLDEPTSAQRALIRALAGTRIELHFERVYSTVWASQLALLRYLNTRPMRVTEQQLRPFYDDATSKYPVLYQSYPFEAYLRFLESHYLIDRSAGPVGLTLTGKEFLKWLVELGRAGPLHG